MSSPTNSTLLRSGVLDPTYSPSLSLEELQRRQSTSSNCNTSSTSISVGNSANANRSISSKSSTDAALSSSVMALAEQWRPTISNKDIPTQVKVVKLPRKRRLSLDKRRVTPDIDSLTASFSPSTSTSTGCPHLSSRSSAKDGSFRGGSLKNVMEDKSLRDGDDDEEIEAEINKLLAGRRFSDNEDEKNNNEPQLKKRPSWSRSRSAGKNGSFRNNSMRSLGGSLKNVLEDIEAADDINSLHPEYNEEHLWAEKKDMEVTGAGKRRPSWSTKNGSFRNRSLKSIRTNASSSSIMSSSGSDNIRESIDISETRTSIDIMDFGVSHNQFMNYREGGSDTTFSNSQRSLGSTVSSRGLVDSDGFLGWGGGASSKNIHIDLNPSTTTNQVGGKKAAGDDTEKKDEEFNKSGTSIVGALLEDCRIQLDTNQGGKKESNTVADVLGKRNPSNGGLPPTPQAKSKSRSKLLRRLSSSFSTTSLSKSISASFRRSSNSTSEDSTLSTNIAPRSFRKSTEDENEDAEHDVNIAQLRKELVRKSGRRSSWTDICVETLFSS